LIVHEGTVQADDAAVRAVIKAISAWQTGPAGAIAADIRPHLAEDAVVVGPDLRRLVRGRDAVARSYEEFAASAKIITSALDDPQIDISADVAVATMTWRMRYAYEGTETAEAGVDTYVLSRRGGCWLVVWRRLETNAA
jgi:ketosteroid isomerase-like protein